MNTVCAKFFLSACLFSILGSFAKGQVTGFKTGDDLFQGGVQDNSGCLYKLFYPSISLDVDPYNNSSLVLSSENSQLLLKYDQALNYKGFLRLKPENFSDSIPSNLYSFTITHFFPSSEDSVVYVLGHVRYNSEDYTPQKTIFFGATGLYDNEPRFFKHLEVHQQTQWGYILDRVATCGLVGSTEDWIAIMLLGSDNRGVIFDPLQQNTEYTKDEKVYIVKYSKTDGAFLGKVDVGSNQQPTYFALPPDLYIDPQNNLYSAVTNNTNGYRTVLKKYDQGLNLLHTFSPGTGSYSVFWIKNLSFGADKIYGSAIFNQQVTMSGQTYYSNSGNSHAYAAFEMNPDLNGQIKVITPFVNERPPEDYNTAILKNADGIHLIMLSKGPQTLSVGSLQNAPYELECDLNYNVSGIEYDSNWNVKYTYNWGETANYAAPMEPKLSLFSVAGLTLVETLIQSDYALMADGTTTTYDLSAPGYRYVGMLVGTCDELAIEAWQDGDTLKASPQFSGVAYMWYKLPDMSLPVSQQPAFTITDTGTYVMNVTFQGCEIFDTLYVDTMNISTNTGGFLVYPNPTNDLIVLSDLQEPVELVQIQTLYGAILSTIFNYQPNAPISLQGLQAGIYKVVVHYVSGNSAVELVVIAP